MHVRHRSTPLQSVRDKANSSTQEVWAWSEFSFGDAFVSALEKVQQDRFSELSRSVYRRPCFRVTLVQYLIYNNRMCLRFLSTSEERTQRAFHSSRLIILGFIFFILTFPSGNLENGIGRRPTGLKQPSAACLCLPFLSLSRGQKKNFPQIYNQSYKTADQQWDQNDSLVQRDASLHVVKPCFFF